MALLCMFVAAPTGVVRRAWEEMRAGVEGVKGRGGKEDLKRDCTTRSINNYRILSSTTQLNFKDFSGDVVALFVC